MHPNAERVQTALDELRIGTKVVELEGSARTVAEAATSIGTIEACILKSLIFEAGGEPLLVIMSGCNRVSTEKVSRIVGKTVRRPDADFVRRTTGFPIGGVPPVGLATPMRILVDQDLLNHEVVWAAAGTWNAVFPTEPRRLVEVIHGEVQDVRE